MIQDLLTMIIICAALAYTGYSIYKAFGNSKRKTPTCGGCSGCSPKEKCEHAEHMPDLRKL